MRVLAEKMFLEQGSFKTQKEKCQPAGGTIHKVKGQETNKMLRYFTKYIEIFALLVALDKGLGISKNQ